MTNIDRQPDIDDQQYYEQAAPDLVVNDSADIDEAVYPPGPDTQEETPAETLDDSSDRTDIETKDMSETSRPEDDSVPVHEDTGTQTMASTEDVVLPVDQVVVKEEVVALDNKNEPEPAFEPDEEQVREPKDVVAPGDELSSSVDMAEHEIDVDDANEPKDDQQPRLFRQIESEATVSLTPKEYLAGSKVHPNLIEEIEEASELYRPLMTLSLGRRPEGDDQRKGFEGRGAYHQVPYRDNEVTVYAKGVGSDLAFEHPEGPNPGYPASADNLVLPSDVYSKTDQPRLVGTLTATWGILEEVNAYEILRCKAEEEGWHTLQEAIDAGVTIPLGLTQLPGLTSSMGKLIGEYIESGPDERERQILANCRPNDNLASIAMIVPGNERVNGGIDDDGERMAEKLYTPEDGRAIGRTLRQLAEVGFCYSYISSHTQNIYRGEGLLPQADSCDLATLGEYKGKDVQTTDDNGEEVTRHISAEDQRAALLTRQMIRNELSPKFLASPESGEYSVADTVEVQNAFWEEYLSGIADPTAISHIPKLMPFLHTEIYMAASQLVLDHCDQQAWEDMADRKRAVLAGYENEFGVLTEYDKEIGENLPEYYDTAFSEMYHDQRLSVQSLANYLKTGDAQYIAKDRRLARLVPIAFSFSHAKNDELRDKAVCNINGAAFSETVSSRARGQDLALADQFEGRHLNYIASRLRERNPKDAIGTMIILNMVADPNYRNMPALGGAGERIGHHYARRLLTDNPRYEVILQAFYDVNLARYCGALRGRQYLDIHDVAKRDGVSDYDAARRMVSKGSLNVEAFALANDLPQVDIIVRSILGKYIDDSDKRKEISDWLGQYQDLQYEYSQMADHTSTAARVLVYTMGVMSENAPSYAKPELALAHDSWAATELQDTEPQVALQACERAVGYYNNKLEARRFMGTADPFARVSTPTSPDNVWLRRLESGTLVDVTPGEQTYDGSKKYIAGIYDDLGLPRVSVRYK